MGSSAFLLPLEPRGLYREMLTQAWRRGGRLPASHEAVRRAVGCTKVEWRRCWPKIERYWRVDGDALVNDTQLDVLAHTTRLHDERVEAGRLGGHRSAASKRQAKLEANQQADALAKVNSPSPSPSPSPSERSPRGIAPTRGIGAGVMAGSLPRDHVQHAFCGRVCVPQFLQGDFLRALGESEVDPGATLRLFYEATLKAIPEAQPIGDEPVKFWRAAFVARFGSARGGTRTAALTRATAEFLQP